MATIHQWFPLAADSWFGSMPNHILTINKLYWSFLRRRLVSGSKEEENRPESDSDGLNRAGMKTPWVITLTLTLIGKFKSSFWVLSVWMIIFCVLVVKTLEGEQLSHLCSSFLQIVPDHIAGTSCTFLQPRVYWWHTFKTVLVFPAILMISVHNQRWFIDYTEEDVARVSKTKLSKKNKQKPCTCFWFCFLVIPTLMWSFCLGGETYHLRE